MLIIKHAKLCPFVFVEIMIGMLAGGWRKQDEFIKGKRNRD